MSERTIHQERDASIDPGRGPGRGPGRENLWAWVALGAAVAALAMMFVLPETPAVSIGAAIVGLIAARAAKGTERRRVVLLGVVVAVLVIAVHLSVGLLWSGTTVVGG